ncbi:MAG: response regulator [Anaerolineales bacterium]|nr:response regulator [Anaerolineales bacterium]
MRNLLATWNGACAETDSAAAALVLLDSAARDGAPFDLVLMDMQMPDMDGVELARMIKGEPALAATKLILVTSLGYRSADNRDHHFAAQLTKPIRKIQLYEQLQIVLGRGRPAIAPEEVIRPDDAQKPRRQPRILLAEDNVVNQTVARDAEKTWLQCGCSGQWERSREGAERDTLPACVDGLRNAGIGWLSGNCADPRCKCRGIEPRGGCHCDDRPCNARRS